MLQSLLDRVQKRVFAEAVLNRPTNETVLAKELGVSRTPIREVLSYLEEEGFIERKHRIGIKLRKVSLQEAIEIYEFRAAIEGLACYLLAGNLNEEILVKIKNANLQLEYSKDLMDAGEKDAAFHEIILENCGNRYLSKVAKNMRIITTSFKILHNIPDNSFKDGLPRKLRFPHVRIIEALESGNPRIARKMMSSHVMEAKRNTIRKFRAAGFK